MADRHLLGTVRAFETVRDVGFYPLTFHCRVVIYLRTYARPRHSCLRAACQDHCRLEAFADPCLCLTQTVVETMAVLTGCQQTYGLRSGCGFPAYLFMVLGSGCVLGR